MKLGIGSWTFPWSVGLQNKLELKKRIGLDEILDLAVDMDVGLIQICDNLPLCSLDDKMLQRFKENAQQHKVDIEVGTRGVLPENLLNYLDIAMKLDSGYVRTIVDTPDTEDGLELAIKHLKQVVPLYEKQNVKIGLENHERHRVKHLAYIIEKVDSPNLGICLDTINSIGVLESVREVAEVLAPYVNCLHFKDVSVIRLNSNMGFTIQGSVPGEGFLDIDAIMDILTHYDRSFNVILEQWPPFSGDIYETIEREKKWAYEGIEYLKGKLF